MLYNGIVDKTNPHKKQIKNQKRKRRICMKLKKVTALCMTAVLAMSFTACSKDEDNSNNDNSASSIKYTDITLGTDDTDLKAEIKLLTNRTDMLESTYAGTSWDEYIAEFNKLYPNITVKVEGITNYADDALLRLTSKEWGDIMMIPAVDSKNLSDYFISYGTLEEMDKEIRFASSSAYDGQVYGVPVTATAGGVVYNKKVFEEAGITELPKTPDEFIAALKLIKEKTDAIPLYTNYASGWALGQWDSYIFGAANGSATYKNQDVLHTSNPFSDNGKDSGAYAVFSILYNAVKEGLIEEDYMTTDWEGSKGMINRGEIGCMVLGSWAYTQMRDADVHGDDVGYMAFPVSVDGKQYAGAGPDYRFGINKYASEDNQKAAMIFVKWMTEKSSYSYNEGGIPIAQADDKWPAVYDSFNENGVEFVVDEPAIAGEEGLYDTLNSDSELAFDGDNGVRGQDIIVNASQNGKTLDEIMDEWNQKWTNAQKDNDVEIR